MTGMGHGIREGALNLEPKYTCTVWLAQSGPHALVHPKDGGTPSVQEPLRRGWEMLFTGSKASDRGCIPGSPGESGLVSRGSQGLR